MNGKCTITNMCTNTCNTEIRVKLMHKNAICKSSNNMHIKGLVRNLFTACDKHMTINTQQTGI